MKVSKFSNAAQLRQYEWDGIALQMPWDLIAERLAKRGFEEATPARPAEFREFYKGVRTRVVAQPGESTYALSLTRRADGRVKLDYRRSLVPGGPPNASLVGTDSYKAAIELKRLACDGIVDPVERHRACPPNTENEVRFEGNRRAVWLAGEMELQITATPQGVRIVMTDFR